MAVQAKALQMVHDTDPRKDILTEVAADVAEFEPTGRDLLCVVYERPESLAVEGGKRLWLPETSSARTEDKFQGIVALVVKVGPRADEASANFKNGLGPKIGDWVIAPISASMSFLLGKRTARLIEAQMIRGVIQRPDMVA